MYEDELFGLSDFVWAINQEAQRETKSNFMN